MPKTTEQYEEIRQEKKQIIMFAALELFAERGFNSTSISHISEKVGMSKGLLYNYFCSKEDLLKVLIDNIVNELADMIDPNHDKIITEEEALQFFDLYFEVLQTRKNELKLIIQIIMQPEVYRFINRNMLLKRVFEYGQMLTVFFSNRNMENPKMVMMSIFSIVRGFTMQYVLSSTTFSQKFLMEYKEYLKETYIMGTK